MKIALAQINPVVGDLEGNFQKITGYIKKACRAGADLVVFPELCTTGYPPKDLLLKPSFIRENLSALESIVKETQGIVAVVGFVEEDKSLYNSAAIIKDGNLLGIQRKTHLPNYDVFDEKRYFKAATGYELFEVAGKRFGVTICEDIWVNGYLCSGLVDKGAEFIVNISASPFHAGKLGERNKLLSLRARSTRVPILYCNLVGGQDDLVFDGGSCIFNGRGELVARARRFEEALLVSGLAKGEVAPMEGPIEELFKALVLGIRDYVVKNGFTKVVVGLSGGIDSAVTTVLACKALGKENVLGVFMPSSVTSRESFEDARKLAFNLGVGFSIIPITEPLKAYLKALSKEFEGTKKDATEENLQARIRGNILMALSNKFGYLVLSTGNKSELAVGYTTLYGDLAGGLAVISDVPKSMVYGLSKYLNTEKELIPQRILEKEPSAELRPGQKDREDIPPYSILDPILHAYIEDNKSREEIVAMGYDEDLVRDIIYRVDRSEYKRQQAPIGIKVTTKAFGSGRRMPITNRYKG
jgi:NAD+ synthase (glutamine-hydrolysing)